MDIEKYIPIEELKRMPTRQAALFKKIYTTYEGINGDNTMLASAMTVCVRLYPAIKDLSEQQQLDIVHETTMIAYDARIKAFEHMIDYKPDSMG